MSELSQKNRLISVNTPLGTDTLILTQVDGVEEVGKPFLYRLYMLSDNLAIDPTQLLGQSINVKLRYDDNQERWIHGRVCRFQAKGIGAEGRREYEAEITAWNDLLRKNLNCRIFQKKSVPDILAEVFRHAGFEDFVVKATGGGNSTAPRAGLHGQYQERDYCVQFNESDFNFTQRLMQEEGIFYYFQHSENNHVMVLCDNTDNYPPKALRLHQYSGDRAGPYVRDWVRISHVTSDRSEQRAYNFLTSSKPVSGKASGKLKGAKRHPHERYRYNERFDKPTEGARYSRLDIEADQAEYDTYRGTTNVFSLASLSRFAFVEHSNPAEKNREYIVTGTRLYAEEDTYRNAGQAHQGLSLEIRCIPVDVPYRLQGHFPRPQVHGIQTASVTGPADKEIHCDEYGRICVLFHWDRQGKPDKQNTCWLRVAQDWAGQKFGSVFTPRIGQEVIVSFIQGDPDRPVVTGQLYNDKHRHPYSLPDDKTISGIRTRSTPNGAADQFNELRFDDRKDKEEVFLQAQKDFNTWIKHNETNRIDENRTTKVGKNEAIEVGENRTVDIKQNDQLTSGKDTRIKAGNALTLEAGSQITLKTGGAEIVMGSDGSIKISGANVQVNGTTVSLKGALLKLN
ncbi:type VI secretion system Vgr family protein [Mangrovitalea sediminis]|uniref:type VI secretion system Vgr family protein n=1 Tax=Mangrovitalea sediminis TaxID=1982043 RepID=UPI000BE556BC|nr:type VI secretion system tip protein TssI/VgrG [Mangrovitalea sediminis]